MQAATLSLADNQQFPFSRALGIRMYLHFNRLLKGQGSSPRLLTPRARAELELLSSWGSGPGSPSLPLLTQLGQGKVCAFHAHRFLWRTAEAATDKLSCSTGARMLALQRQLWDRGAHRIGWLGAHVRRATLSLLPHLPFLELQRRRVGPCQSPPGKNWVAPACLVLRSLAPLLPSSLAQ